MGFGSKKLHIAKLQFEHE